MITADFYNNMDEGELFEFANYSEKQSSKFVEIFDENNPKETYNEIKKGYIMDATKLSIYAMLDDKKLLHFHVMHLLGKYCFFIFEFEKIEQYELCAKVIEDLYQFINDEVGIARDLFDELLEDSIIAYRNVNKLIEKGYGFEEEEE